MNSYELHIDTVPKRSNGCFQKGNIPFNKGVPMREWMDGRKIRKVKKCLEIGRKLGNKKLPEINSKKVVAIKDGVLTAYSCAADAERILRQKGIKVNQNNIRNVCHHKVQKIKCNNGRNEYQYIRKKAGGYQWFFADKIDEYKNLLK